MHITNRSTEIHDHDDAIVNTRYLFVMNARHPTPTTGRAIIGNIKLYSEFGW